MRVPWLCSACNCVNLIDLMDLESVTIDKLRTARGFTCNRCDGWTALSYTSPSLREMERKIERYTPAHEQYQFLLKKLMHKAMGMAQRQ